MIAIDSLAQSTIVTLTALTAIGAALTWIARRIRKAIRRAQHLGRRLDAVADIADAQLTINGGGSMLDKVNKIEANHLVAEKHWKALEEAQSDILTASQQHAETLVGLVMRFQGVESRQRVLMAVIDVLLSEQTPERQKYFRELYARLEAVDRAEHKGA